MQLALRRALAAARDGRPVVVIDDEPGRARDEEVGLLMLLAESTTSEQMAMIVRYSSGFVCVAMHEHEADRLDLPAMRCDADRANAPLLTVSVDAVGTGTGISAADRAFTLRQLANPTCGPMDFCRPGHVVGIRTHGDGVLGRRALPEAAVDIATLADLRPVVAIAAVPSPTRPTEMATAAELREFAEHHRFPIVSVQAILAHRLRHTRHVERGATARIPLAGAVFDAVGYRSTYDAREHVALVLGDIGDGIEVPLHVHSECVLGDVFGSMRCQCAQRLQSSLERITEAGRGVIVYLREGETSASGLLATLSACSDQDSRAQVPRAGHAAGPPSDSRDGIIGTQILCDLGIQSVRLLTASLPAETRLTEAGLQIPEQPPVMSIDRVHVGAAERPRCGSSQRTSQTT